MILFDGLIQQLKIRLQIFEQKLCSSSGKRMRDKRKRWEKVEREMERRGRRLRRRDEDKERKAEQEAQGAPGSVSLSRKRWERRWDGWSVVRVAG